MARRLVAVAGAVCLAGLFSSLPAVAAPSAKGTADVEVVMVGPTNASPGAHVEYRIEVTNRGLADAKDVIAVAEVSRRFALTELIPEAALTAGTATWQLGALAAGESRSLVVAGPAPDVRRLTVSASATSPTPDPDPSNNDGSDGRAQVRTRIDVPPTPAPDPTPDPTPTPAATTPTPAAPTPANNPPVVAVGGHSTAATVPVSGRAVAVDSDAGQSLTFSLAASPRSGTVDLASDGNYKYAPRGGFTGRDAFTVRACDSGAPALCSHAEVAVTVVPAPSADTVMTWAGVRVRIDVRINDHGESQRPQWTAWPSHGSGREDGDGAMVYTPRDGYTGWDTMRYRSCAPTAADVCSEQVVTIGVRPRAEDDVVRSSNAQPVRVEAMANDVGDAGNPVIVDQPEDGTVRVLDDGALLYTPEAAAAEDEAYDDEFAYQVCSDNAAELCDTAVVEVAMELPESSDLDAWLDELDPSPPVDEPVAAAHAPTPPDENVSWATVGALAFGGWVLGAFVWRRRPAWLRREGA